MAWECRKEVQALSPKGEALQPRGYHAMAAVGRSVYAFGGRSDSPSDLLSVRSSLRMPSPAQPCQWPLGLDTPGSGLHWPCISHMTKH